jgi:glycosidase
MTRFRCRRTACTRGARRPQGVPSRGPVTGSRPTRCGLCARSTRASFELDQDFYEIHVRGFYDANDDGAGDFRGLTEKLDYLQWLGIDCIWLLPFYKSPLRDGGYDISNFTDVHPDYGTIEDVREFINAAHARQIRVIADLVMSHTSIDHPWFQESRSSPDSPKRDSYVRSENDERHRADHLHRHRDIQLEL